MSLLDPTQQTLEAAMRGATLRETLLTNNLANVETPGYKRQDVDFHATLAAALQNGQPLDNVGFQPVTDPQSVRADGNGVAPDRESADLAENGLEYQALTQVMSARNAILQYAMGTR